MNCALVGMGSMGQNHYKTILANEDVNFVGVVEPNDKLVEDIKITKT